jgi:hypothetical protein
MDMHTHVARHNDGHPTGVPGELEYQESQHMHTHVARHNDGHPTGVPGELHFDFSCSLGLWTGHLQAA